MESDAINLIISRLDAQDAQARAEADRLHREIDNIIATVQKVEIAVVSNSKSLEANEEKLEDHIKSTGDKRGFISSLKKYWQMILILLLIGRMSVSTQSNYVQTQPNGKDSVSYVIRNAPATSTLVYRATNDKVNKVILNNILPSNLNIN